MLYCNVLYIYIYIYYYYIYFFNIYNISVPRTSEMMATPLVEPDHSWLRPEHTHTHTAATSEQTCSFIGCDCMKKQHYEHRVETPLGVLHVMVHGAGNVRRPAILTFHDVGMDSKSCFSTLFKFEEMQEIVKNFTVVHVDAPGQEDGAAIYPAGYQYATMDQISDMLPAVLQYFNFRTVIGVGVGAGAYILSKFTLSNPEAVEGLVLINVDTNARGWMDWAAQKVCQLLGYYQFDAVKWDATSMIDNTMQEMQFGHLDNQTFMFFFLPYSRRDLDIERNNTFKCPVMLVVGDQAPYEEAAVECNSKLDPTTTSFLKMADAGGMPQLTQPSKLTEAFKYFIQGMGYMASSCMTRLSRSRTTSLSSSYSMEGSRSRSRTLSQGSQGGQLPPSPSHTMEVSC
uniref:NDRG family member 2 n=1 Tax=Sinocyclocheilus anshuiensis TaxID=1608454 RepID=A0A671MQM4_9TELE